MAATSTAQQPLTPAELAELSAEVRALAAERDAVILAHNYQLPEIQGVADIVGDSLFLSQEAAKVPQPVIAFCGVHFMAETASVLSPKRPSSFPMSMPAARSRTRSPRSSSRGGRPSTPGPSP